MFLSLETLKAIAAIVQLLSFLKFLLGRKNDTNEHEFFVDVLFCGFVALWNIRYFGGRAEARPSGAGRQGHAGGDDRDARPRLRQVHQRAAAGAGARRSPHPRLREGRRGDEEVQLADH